MTLGEPHSNLRDYMIMETMGFIINYEKEMKLKIQVSPLCWLMNPHFLGCIESWLRTRADSQTAGIRLQALPLASWVTFGKLYLIPLSLSFLTCKMGIKMVSTSQGCCMD